MSTLIERCDSIIESKMSEAFENRDNFKKYLDVAFKFYRYDLHNQLLIYAQAPDATALAGEKEYRMYGGVVKPDSVPIVLKYPYITVDRGKEKNLEEEGHKADPEARSYSYEYVPVPVFKIEDVDIVDKYEKPDTSNSFSKRIKYLTGFSITTPPGFTADNGKKYKVDFEAKKIILGDVRDRMAAMTLLQAYVDYDLEISEYGKTLTEEMRFATGAMVKYIMLRFFGFSTNSVSLTVAVFLKKLSYEDKEKILQAVNTTAYLLISDLHFYYLRFCDTAFCNSLLYVPDKVAFSGILQEAANMIIPKNKCLGEDLQMFSGTVLHTEDSYIPSIYSFVNRRKVTNYPEIIMMMEAKDFYDEIPPLLIK